MSYQCESGFTLIPLHGGLSGLSGLHHCTGLHWLGWSSGSSLSGSELCISLGSQCIILWCGGQFDTIITGELLGNALIDVWYHRLRLAAVQHHKNTLHTYYSPSPSHPQQNVIKLQRVGQHSTLENMSWNILSCRMFYISSGQSGPDYDWWPGGARDCFCLFVDNYWVLAGSRPRSLSAHFQLPPWWTFGEENCLNLPFPQWWVVSCVISSVCWVGLLSLQFVIF